MASTQPPPRRRALVRNMVVHQAASLEETSRKPKRISNDQSVVTVSRLLLSALILLSFGALSWAQASPGLTPQGELTARVDRLFDKWNHTDSPGCALSVMKDGRIIYKQGYGMADLDHDVIITPSTVFHVASMSKQ